MGAPVRSSAVEGARVRVPGGLPLQLTSVQRQQGLFSAAKGRRNNTFGEDKWRELMTPTPLPRPFIVAFKGRLVVKLLTLEDP